MRKEDVYFVLVLAVAYAPLLVAVGIYRRPGGRVRRFLTLCSCTAALVSAILGLSSSSAWE
jgi:hypothetical protein